jgi:hypothetical protein
MRNKTRSLALAGAAGVLTAPTAIALAADGDAAAPTAGHPLRAKIADAPTARAQMRDDRHDRLVRRHRRLAQAAGEHVGADAHLWSNRRLSTDIRRLRKKLGARQTTSTAATGAGAATPQLAAIAACESGGNPHAVGGGGAFRGKYQFTYETWAAVGGSGDPADAPEAEQDRRAAQLMASSGRQNWPVCG